jgi:2-oxoglutarate dehydrogenase E2 component (dihydrolipoamide succinyltransferase)
MANYNIIMPKLGESVEEATITKWFVKEGDMIAEDQPIVELATDKVDSEVPSPVDGKIIKLNYKEDDIVAVGEVIAVISLDGTDEVIEESKIPEKIILENTIVEKTEVSTIDTKKSKRFYSPLVKTIANKEGLTIDELDSISGTGNNGRVNKNDVFDYLENKVIEPEQAVIVKKISEAKSPVQKISLNPGDEVVPMTRMRKLIADHMVMSVKTSAHVTTVIEADVTNMVNWRNGIKDEFMKKYGQKLTYMPIFTEAVAKALRDFPQVNASTDGENIIFRKEVNIGIAVALPEWNLIVPVVKNADQKNLAGLATDINSLASNARANNLKPDDVSAGTFSITNFGSFNNLHGTPVINQPQVAILATGSIVKKPAVMETEQGDFIAIRNKMYLSLSYDHRIVDGALGGAFLEQIAKYLEAFDTKRTI